MWFFDPKKKMMWGGLVKGKNKGGGGVDGRYRELELVLEVPLYESTL